MFLTFINLIALQILPAGAAEKPSTKGKVNIPRCVRPMDLSDEALTISYNNCVQKKEDLCLKQKVEPPECKSPIIVDFRKRFPSNPTDIKPQERCAVQKDGYYRCTQDPIRFIVKEDIKPLPGVNIKAASPAPDSSPDGSKEPGSTPAAPATGPQGGQEPSQPAPAPASTPSSDGFKAI